LVGAVEYKLNCPGPDVIDGFGSSYCGSPQLLSELLSDIGGRCLFKDLLMAPLNTAVPFIQINIVPKFVRKDLNFYVPAKK
jgi:hypothetical protein